MVILSFCGKIGSGKTASTNLAYKEIQRSYIEKNLIGIMHLPSLESCMENNISISPLVRIEKKSFADPIRKGLNAMFNLDYHALTVDKDRSLKDYFFKGITTNRELMVKYAETLRENLGEDIFAQIMNKHILRSEFNKQTELFLIDDLRKDVEFDMLASHNNSYTVWLEKEGNENEYDGEIMDVECDYEVNWRTPQELESAIHGILKDLELI